MRTLFKILLFSLLLLQFDKTYSQWKVINLVDDFGDKVGESIGYIGKGFFSNTATSRSDLLVRLVFREPKKEFDENYVSFDSFKETMEEIYAESKKSVRKEALEGLQSKYQSSKADYENKLGSIVFTVYEYGNKKALFTRALYDFTIKFKLSDGSVISIVNEKNKYAKPRTNFTLSADKRKDDGKIYQSILDSNPVKVVITHGSSIYNFTIEGKVE